MQKIYIKNTRVASHYARFLSAKCKNVKYVACFENKSLLEVDMYPCNLPVSCEAKKEIDARR